MCFLRFALWRRRRSTKLLEAMDKGKIISNMNKDAAKQRSLQRRSSAHASNFEESFQAAGVSRKKGLLAANLQTHDGLRFASSFECPFRSQHYSAMYVQGMARC